MNEDDYIRTFSFYRTVLLDYRIFYTRKSTKLRKKQKEDARVKDLVNVSATVYKELSLPAIPR